VRRRNVMSDNTIQILLAGLRAGREGNASDLVDEQWWYAELL
jgi:hypothetical protein